MKYCKVIPNITNIDNVSLLIVEKNTIPFQVKRLFIIQGFYKDGIERGFHAHRNCEQMIFCLKGSVIVRCENKEGETYTQLYNSDRALHVPKMTWNELLFIERDSIILVLASQEYSEDDYIRDYDEFLRCMHE